MPGRKLPHSPLRPGAPNYANARGREADKANAGIEEEANSGKSPASVPDNKVPADIKASPIKNHAEYHDASYAQYMNRGSGRYEEFVEDQSEGSFGPDRDHQGKTSRIHRQKSAKL
jgi:hypothetical protein